MHRHSICSPLSLSRSVVALTVSFHPGLLAGATPPQMTVSVTVGTEGDQILLGIISHSPAGLDVMNLQICEPAATLAPPPIPFQHLLVQLPVGDGVKAQPRSLGGSRFHGYRLLSPGSPASAAVGGT